MPEEKLFVTTKELPGGIMSVAVKGYVLTVTCPELTRVLDNLFAQQQYNLVIDLTEVKYLGSTGAGILINALTTAQENQGKVVLVRPQARVMEVFNLLGIDQIVTVAGSISSALKTFTL